MRVSLNLSEEMLERVDQEAKRLGTSRGAMLTTWIGEKISNLDMSRQFTETVQTNFSESLSKAIQKAFTDEEFVKSLASASETSPQRKEVKKRGKK